MTVWPIYCQMEEKMLLWFTSKWTSKRKLIQQTRGRPMLWCHPKIKRLLTPIIKPPSGVHLTVLGLQVVATTFEGSAQGFQTHLPLKVPEATDSANIWCKFWIPHLSLFTRSYILDYKHLGSYVYTQNKQNTYIIYTCIYIYIIYLSLHRHPEGLYIYTLCNSMQAFDLLCSMDSIEVHYCFHLPSTLLQPRAESCNYTSSVKRS